MGKSRSALGKSRSALVRCRALSFRAGDGLAMHVSSGMHANRKAGEKEALNEVCCRVLVKLLMTDANQVRLTPSNFRRGAEGINAVLRVVMLQPAPPPRLP